MDALRDALETAFDATGARAVSEIDGVCTFDGGLACLRRGEPIVFKHARAQEWPLSRLCNRSPGCVATALADFFGADTLVPIACASPARGAPSLEGGSGSSYGAASTRLPLHDGLARVLRGAGAYIKDFHFLCADPVSVSTAYAVPYLFCDDSLNAHFDAAASSAGGASSDYRFLYIGGAGSWTPLHHDVLSSCSWSVNVRGYKLWLFVPPLESRRELCGGPWGELQFGSLLLANEVAVLEHCGVTAVHGADSSLPRRPSVAAPAPLDCDAILSYAARARTRHQLGGAVRFCVQCPGTAVFVPPGWHHEVHNLCGFGDLTVSVNHNFFNPVVGMREAHAFLSAEVSAARLSIADCRPPRPSTPAMLHAWELEVQRLTRANCSLCMDDFVSILVRCAQRNFEYVAGDAPSDAAAGCSSVSAGDCADATANPVPASAPAAVCGLDAAFTGVRPYLAPHLCMPSSYIDESRAALRQLLEACAVDAYVQLRQPGDGIVLRGGDALRGGSASAGSESTPPHSSGASCHDASALICTCDAAGGVHACMRPSYLGARGDTFIRAELEAHGFSHRFDAESGALAWTAASLASIIAALA